jgi:hypothetical protein
VDRYVIREIDWCSGEPAWRQLWVHAAAPVLSPSACYHDRGVRDESRARELRLVPLSKTRPASPTLSTTRELLPLSQ